MAYNVWKTIADKQSGAKSEGAAFMPSKHAIIEKNIGLMIVLIIVAISFGGLAQIVPLFFSTEHQ